MRTLLTSTVTLALAAGTVLPVPAAFAHGGCYRHASPEPPPNSCEPDDPPSMPDTGAGMGAGQGVGPGGFGGRGPGGAKPPGYADWPVWWGHEMDSVLGTRRLVRRARSGPLTGGPGTDTPQPVSADAIATKIVPALRAFLDDDEQSFHVRSAAILALAKAGDMSIVPTLRRFVLDEKHEAHREVRESAALAFGLLGSSDPETLEFLRRVVRRQSASAGYERPFAAISLGLIGRIGEADGATTETLLDVVSRREAGLDVKPACLLALGLLADSAALPDLLAIVRTARSLRREAADLDDIERSYAVLALARTAASGEVTRSDRSTVLDELASLLDPARSGPGVNVRRSAAIALGELAPCGTNREQLRALSVLRERADADFGDAPLKYDAIASIGRIGADASASERARVVAVDTLRHVLEAGREAAPGFAAVALGLVGRAVVDSGGPPPEDAIRAPLREAFARTTDPSLRGALALASGLVRDPLASEALLAVLEHKGGESRLRGWCALSLGLIGDARAAAPVRALLRDSVDRELRLQCATAAGLFGDAGLAADLVDVLRDVDASNYELGTCALALGRLGDERSIDALLTVAADEKRCPDLTRALALVALGVLSDRRDVPVLARATRGLNDRANVPAITELLSIL